MKIELVGGPLCGEHRLLPDTWSAFYLRRGKVVRAHYVRCECGGVPDRFVEVHLLNVGFAQKASALGRVKGAVR